MGKRRKDGRRAETPQEAWERMRSAGGGSSTANGGQSSLSGGPGTAVRPEPVAVPPPPPPRPVEPAATPPASPPRAEPAVARPAPPPPAPTRAEQEEPSVSDLVKQLTEQTSTLVKQEMALAQAELKEKGKKAGIGAGLFGVGGLVGFFGGAGLVVAAVLALSTALDAWLSALIVAVVLLAVAGVAALMGKKEIEQATPPAPEATVESVKKDVETVKESARR